MTKSQTPPESGTNQSALQGKLDTIAVCDQSAILLPISRRVPGAERSHTRPIQHISSAWTGQDAVELGQLRSSTRHFTSRECDTSNIFLVFRTWVLSHDRGLSVKRGERILKTIERLLR